MDICCAYEKFHKFLRLFVYYYFSLDNHQNAHNYLDIRKRYIREEIFENIPRYLKSDRYQSSHIRIRYPNYIIRI